MLQLALPFPKSFHGRPWSTAHCNLEATTTTTIFRLFQHRSPETAEHVVTMGVLVEKLANIIGLPHTMARRLGLAAQLHDVGKMGIPDAILNKPGRLTPLEYKAMKRHTVLGKDLLNDSTQPILTYAAIIAHQHHERWDGLGYPRKLAGESIHLFGRLAAICDVFDALSRNRIYRKAWPPELVYTHLRDQRAKAFDPLLLDVFLNYFEEFQILRQRTNHEAVLVLEEAAS